MLYRAHRPGELGPIITGRRVLDEHGLRLGTVTDVVYRRHDHQPEYLIVDPGPLRRSRHVPATGACQTTDGVIIVAWDRDWFRLAPRVTGRSALSPNDRRSLAQHYARR